MEEITEKVKILGSPGYKGKMYQKEDDSIVFLTDGFYHKNDSKSVAKVNNKYFRINSPLIQKLNEDYYGPNYFGLKESCIEINESFWLKRDCVHANIYNGKDGIVLSWLDPHERRYCTSIKAIKEDNTIVSFYTRSTSYQEEFVYDMFSSVWVSKKHPSLIEFNSDKMYVGSSLVTMFHIISKNKKFDPRRINLQSSKLYTLSKDRLAFYKGEYYDYNSIGFSTDINGVRYRPLFSAREVVQMGYDELMKIIDSSVKHVSVLNVDKLFIDKYKSSEDGRNAIISSVISSKPTVLIVDKMFDSNKMFYSNLFKCNVNIEGFDEMFVKLSSNQRSIEKLYESIPEYYRGNKPIALDINYKNQGGNFLFHESRDRSLKRSNLLRRTGKIGYTFGVEIETSHGIFPSSLIEHYGLKAVGDRSIGSLEYVSKPLHGDNGMKTIRDLANDLAKFTMVDKRCGIHIHVGGSNETESPKFNRRFSVYALKLGLILQKELFSLVHPDRTKNVNRDGLSYCGLIESKYKDISMSNYKSLLGKYVYGEAFSDGMNSRSRLFRWIQTRYKWLNLINCNSDNGGRSDAGTNSRFQTIEFRLWDGTLVAEDIENFILISLAFTRFADCHQGTIDSLGDKIDLEFVIDKAIRGKALKQRLTDWIAERKQKHLKEKAI